ncbi:MAG: hypothetical protein Q4C82_03470 [Eubacteriales bacterium]|nr:hypothetical protein [Eubacteriales bacterium]
MKKWISAVCILLTVLMTAGCSSSFDPSASSLYIKKDGTIVQAVVETFEKEYYSLDEFRSMVEKEVDTYNQRLGQDKIRVQSVELENDTLHLLLEYEDAETYSLYNEEYFFMGTVEEALDQGLSFDMIFRDKDYEEYTTAEATEKKNNSVIAAKEESVIELQQAVKYVSSNVEVLDDHTVQIMAIEDADEYAYIIY